MVVPRLAHNKKIHHTFENIIPKIKHKIIIKKSNTIKNFAFHSLI